MHFQNLVEKVTAKKKKKSGVRLAILQFTKVQGRSLMITSRMYLVLLAEFGGKGDRQENRLDPD